MSIPTPTLSGPIGDAYTVTGAGPDDIDEAYELVAAAATALLGYCPDTREDVASLLNVPKEVANWTLAIRNRASGKAAQFWIASRLPGGGDFSVGLRTHPDVPEADVAALSAIAYDTLLDWARVTAADDPPGAATPMVHTGCLHGDHVGLAHIVAAGFVHERTFWGMGGAVSTAATPPPVAGIRIEAPADPK